ncbi:MAG: PQQ-binding-like beta-propeller repeat protein, partial [Planctomycetota bacterium]|nr:PQQ-binding-like beta-propeller repeat protein [Planctomycetota bacterium]
SMGRFERRLPGEGRAMLAMAGARAFLAGTSPAGVCQLYCMDVPGGKVLWRREIPQARSITASGAGVYVRAQRVTALDAYTGRTLWTHAAEGTGPVSVQRGMVCFVDSAGGGRLMGLEAAGGKCVWQVAGVRAFHGLSADCEVAYVREADGGLRAGRPGRAGAGRWGMQDGGIFDAR